MKTSSLLRPALPLLAALVVLAALLLTACQPDTPATRPAAPAPETSVTRAELLGAAWELLDARSTAPGTRFDTTMRIFELYYARTRFAFRPDSQLVADTRRAHVAHAAWVNLLGDDSTAAGRPKPYQPDDFAQYQMTNASGALRVQLDFTGEEDDAGPLTRRGDTLLFRAEAHRALVRLRRVQ